LWCDLGAIKEDNLDEWVYRLGAYECLHGDPLMTMGQKEKFTKEKIRQYVGLTTNVTTTKRSAFDKKVLNGSA